MTKKSFKDTIKQDSKNVYDALAAGNVQDVEDTKNAQNVQKEEKPVMVRLNLKIPAEVKEYLDVQSAKESILQRKNVSLTKYLVDMVKRDMQAHEGEQWELKTKN